MITAQGPKLIEYNVRFGDPECEVLMPRLKSDLVPALLAACDGVLDQVDLRWSDKAALTVVLAAKGYPATPEKGTEIKALDKAEALDDVLVFHAGTKLTATGTLVADGGRVLNLVGLGKTVSEAQARAYAAVDAVDWPGGFCRRDIGWQAVKREREG
jgi:phosphoribosylamine--glycine ligase